MKHVGPIAGSDRDGCNRIVGWFCWRKIHVKRGIGKALNIRRRRFARITMCPRPGPCPRCIQ